MLGFVVYSEVLSSDGPIVSTGEPPWSVPTVDFDWWIDFGPRHAGRTRFAVVAASSFIHVQCKAASALLLLACKRLSSCTAISVHIQSYSRLMTSSWHEKYLHMVQ